MSEAISGLIGLLAPVLIVFVLEKLAPGTVAKGLNWLLVKLIKQPGAVNKIENAVAMKTIDIGFEMYTYSSDSVDTIDELIASLDEKKQKLLALKENNDNPS